MLKDADFDKAINFQSDFAPAYNNRGIARAALNQLEDAIADFDTALNIQPNFVSVYNNRGIAKSEQERYDEAIADFNIAILIPKIHRSL